MIISDQKKPFKHKYLRNLILFMLKIIKQLETLELRLINLLRRIDLN